MPPKSRNKADLLRKREETGKTIRDYVTPPQSPREAPTSPPPPPKKKRRSPPPPPPPAGGAGGGIASYKKGGVVRKTGKALLHAGEIVLPKNVVATLKKLMK